MMQEHCIYAKCFDILDEAQGKIFTGKTESRRQRNLDGRTVVDAMMEYTCKEMTPGISSPHKLAQNRKTHMESRLGKRLCDTIRTLAPTALPFLVRLVAQFHSTIFF